MVSPLNARKQLTAFIQGAKKELLIYDMKIADRAMTRLLEERAKAGVEVRVIGKAHPQDYRAGGAQAERHAPAYPDHNS